MTIETKLNKCLNSVQWSYYLIQKYRNLVNWCETVTTVKLRQFVIAKHNVITPLALVSYLKMAIRWVDAEQRTIAERVSAFLTSGFPVMGVPCPAGASVSVGPNQSLTTISTKPFLPLPSLLYCALPKGVHSRAPKATRTKWKFGKNVSFKDGWTKTWEGDMYVWNELLNGRELAIHVVPRWMGKPRHYQVIYEPRATSKSGRSDVIATTRTLSEAKRRGKAFIKRLRRSA